MREPDNIKTGEQDGELAAAFMRTTSFPLLRKWIHLLFLKSELNCPCFYCLSSQLLVFLMPRAHFPLSFFLHICPFFLDNCPPSPLSGISFQDSINPHHFLKDRLILSNNEMENAYAFTE